MYLIDVSAVDGDNGIEEVVSFTWDVNRVSREYEDGHLSSVGFASSLGGALDKALAACYLACLKVVEVTIQMVNENILDGLPEPMSDQREADLLGDSASELEDARSRREEGHEIRFLYNRSGTFAIAEEPEYDNGVFERGGDVRIFNLSKVSCITARNCGDYRVTLDGGEDFYVTRVDFEKLAEETLGRNVDADDPWN